MLLLFSFSIFVPEVIRPNPELSTNVRRNRAPLLCLSVCPSACLSYLRSAGSAEWTSVPRICTGSFVPENAQYPLCPATNSLRFHMYGE